MKTILLVDDSRNIREYCRQELEEEGYHVVVASDGGEVPILLSQVAPDLVVLDICMPGVNGLETAEWLSTVVPDLPVILYTSYDDICARDGRTWNATACVEKRSDLTELKSVICSALRPSRQSVPYRVGLPPVLSQAATV